MIGPLAEERLEAANALHEEREYSRKLARHASVLRLSCEGCGREEEPGEHFEDDWFSDTPLLCNDCKETRGK